MVLSSLLAMPSFAQQVPEANYDESKVKVENLPDLMISEGGKKVTSVEQWPGHRDWLVRQLAEYEFGFAPTEAVEMSCKLANEGHLKETQIRFREIDITLSRKGVTHTIVLSLFLPSSDSDIKGIFLMPSFQGNHALTNDSQIRITKSWMRESREGGVVNNQATDATRGAEAKRAPISLIASRGYVLASVYYGDIDPDFDDGFKNGVHALYPDHVCSPEHPNRWGSIAAWAWGLSRCVDCIEQAPLLKNAPIAVIGHSRLGKTALWAGATDERFDLVISNNSGCGGAALSRRNFGETVWRINTSFPHWFNDNFPKYNQDPSQLPIDQHFLLAAVAPRPLYVASATKDRWADPVGEYTTAFMANAAYELHGKKGLPSATPPEPGKSVGDSIGYHIREGEHDLLEEDWKHYIDFADRHWK